MTRVAIRKITAITLCIVLACSSMCTFALVTDAGCEDAQFFAANFSDFGAQSPSPTLGSHEARVISWIRNPEFVAENQIVSQVPKSSFTFSSDKLICSSKAKVEDLYTEFKITEYFLRI